MQTATLKETLIRVDGASFREGTKFVVLRRFKVNRETQDCLALGHADGTVVLPWVDPESVEISDDASVPE